MWFNRTNSGRVTHMNARIGSASIVADFSGWAIAHDFGAISPTTRCRNVTMISARTKPATSASHSGAPQFSNNGVSQWCTAGFVVAPSASVHTVMPSWDPASSTDSSDALRRAARAERLDAAASSSRCRRAAMSANSTATKNALAAIRPIVTTATTTGLLIAGHLVRQNGHAHGRRHVLVDVADLGHQGPVERAVLVQQFGRIRIQRDPDGVTHLGEAAELGDDQTRERLVVALGQFVVEGAGHLVDMCIASDDPAVALGADDLDGHRGIVLAGDLADQLLR